MQVPQVRLRHVLPPYRNEPENKDRIGKRERGQATNGNDDDIDSWVGNTAANHSHDECKGQQTDPLN